MKKILLFNVLLLSFTAFSQEYEWQWATRGGGKKSAQGEGSSYSYDSEHIVDIAVDADNNYYYLAFMTQLDTEYDGLAVSVYNAESSTSGNTDLVLISTDCEGTLRWTQTIGGAGRDLAFNIQLDNSGGLYLGANVINISNGVDNYLPPHFSPDDAMPLLGSNTGEPQEAYKTAALLKYSTEDGSLVWRVMPQGDVTLALRYAQMHNLQMDNEGTIHALIGFGAGTHLNGQIVVPDTFISSYKYYIVKFNADGEVLNILPLSLEGALIGQYSSFRYDETLDRYYVGGMRNYGGNSQTIALSFNGIPFAEQSFILAFSNTGAEIWRKEMHSNENSDKRIYSLEIDTNSNVYLLGKYHVVANSTGVSLDSYQLPTEITGSNMFVLKLNSEGAIQWVTVPSGYNTESISWTGVHYSYDLVINENELAVATQITDEVWGNVSIDRPANHLEDPGLLRLNKDTGEAIALHDIMTSPGSRDCLTAVALDNDGNYITGGYFYDDLFTLETDNVPTLTKVGGFESYTDFFIAKLAASPCGSGIAGIKTPVKDALILYPNPTKSVINISTDTTLNSYEIVNILGQVLLKGTLQSSQSSISVDILSAGTYIVKVTGNNGKIFTQKIIKE